MRENKILIQPFQFISYLEVSAYKAMGQHGSIKVKGIIDASFADKYFAMMEKDVWVKVILNNESINIIFFQGIVINLYITNENGVHILEFEAKSGSYLLDCCEHIRSFQANEITYIQMIDACLQPYEYATCNMNIHGDDEINELTLQYRESDWKFFKRLAGKKNTIVYPDNCAKGIQINFGIKETADSKVIESTEYSIKKNSLCDTYIITNRENHEIGDKVRFMNKDLCVVQVESQMEGNELHHKYYLRKKEEIKQAPIKNEKLQGLSLLAVVTAVAGDMVQIRIIKDENAERSGYRWYTYATVYSTPDGTGWYCMPEIGDMVRIHFPDSDERSVYVISSVHMESGQDRINPEHKSFMNKQRKEVLFTPDAIILRNNNGLQLEINDDEGIKLVSNKNIVLQAEDSVTVTSKKASIFMEADNALSMKQGGTALSLNNTIKMTGGKINMN